MLTLRQAAFLLVLGASLCAVVLTHPWPAASTIVGGCSGGIPYQAPDGSVVWPSYPHGCRTPAPGTLAFTTPNPDHVVGPRR